MSRLSWFLNSTQRNTEISFFPSSSWEINAENVVPNGSSPVTYGLTGPTFNYVQAFFNATSLTVNPILAVWSGKFFDQGPYAGQPIVSPVPFAYSGHMVQFKGSAILESGRDIMGNLITSTPLGIDPATNLLRIYTYGGMY